jgi:hypothetical protein
VPGSTPPSHERLKYGRRLKAGVTGGVYVDVTTSPATATITHRIPPHAYFVVSAVFHYLGPSFAVLLFAAIEPLGVAWLRIASAAIVFALWRRPVPLSAQRHRARALADHRDSSDAGGDEWLLLSGDLALAARDSRRD